MIIIMKSMFCHSNSIRKFEAQDSLKLWGYLIRIVKTYAFYILF